MLLQSLEEPPRAQLPLASPAGWGAQLTMSQSRPPQGGSQVQWVSYPKVNSKMVFEAEVGIE